VIRVEGDRVFVSGAATLQSIMGILEPVQAHVRNGIAKVDLSGVEELDSSLLAAVLAWIREAKSLGRDVIITGVPPEFATLADLYGVDELIFPEKASEK